MLWFIERLTEVQKAEVQWLKCAEGPAKYVLSQISQVLFEAGATLFARFGTKFSDSFDLGHTDT